MKVTVLLNCYNAENFISDAIQSVINQSYKNWELIIWDDCSEDGTLKKIKEFKDKRIKIFKNKKNLGLGKSRILAQKKIKNKYVAILDADDKFKKRKLEEYIKCFIKDENLGLIASDYQVIDVDGKKKKYINKSLDKIRKNLKTENILDFFCFNNFFAHSTVMYNKKFAKKVGWYSKKLEYSQDYDLTVKILKNFKVKYLKKKLSFYRVSENNMSSIKSLRNLRAKEKISILRNIKKHLHLNEKQKKLNFNATVISEIDLMLSSMKDTMLIKLIKIFHHLLINPKKIIIFFNFSFKKFLGHVVQW